MKRLIDVDEPGWYWVGEPGLDPYEWWMMQVKYDEEDELVFLLASGEYYRPQPDQLCIPVPTPDAGGYMPSVEDWRDRLDKGRAMIVVACIESDGSMLSVHDEEPERGRETWSEIIKRWRVE